MTSDLHRAAPRGVVAVGASAGGVDRAITALFRSVALGHGQNAIGIVLSGVLDDGILGAGAIKPTGAMSILGKRLSKASCSIVERGDH